ncbi:hypothetical protein E5K00_01670 [Hymenobacter aquaticus]|uniref:DUF4123 domain-containing protein n=1 Tax=Hymenobacter aquaticus TaxID=1867101 RepID=A0A4Z0Q396_9BACT|nr:hypothetical protein [Hymenobacter aquaticus]TGE23949.1 hypothetical protein E5K00_01670 [Hymenobacter aquaticus]
MLFLSETQLFFQLVREAGLASLVFVIDTRPQMCQFYLQIDTFCHFTIEEIEAESIYLITCSPSVFHRQDSHFATSFATALPHFMNWVEALKHHGSVLRFTQVPLGELREAQPRYSLSAEEPLSVPQCQALWQIMQEALRCTETSRPIAHVEQLRLEAESLFTKAYSYPAHHWLYMFVGFLHTHGALSLPLHEAYQELSLLLIDQFDWPAPPPAE